MTRDVLFASSREIAVAQDQPQQPVPQIRRWHSQQQNGSVSGTSVGGRRRQIFRLLALLMGLLGALLAWLMFFDKPVESALLTIPVSQYTDYRWSPNAFAD